MGSIFQTKKWKATAVVAFIIANMTVLIVTVTLPMTLHRMGGGSGSQILSLNCFSLKKIQIWIVGIAGIAFLVDAAAIIATMAKNRKFRLAITALLILTVILTITLASWGSVEGDGRKGYFQETWNNMDDDTKHFVESYFSCCGFESIAEWNSGVLPVNESCYARLSSTLTNITWPDGCYSRVTNSYLDAVTVSDGSDTLTFGESKPNPFYVGFVTSFLFLTLAQAILAILFAISIHSTPKPDLDVDDATTVENTHAKVHDINNGANGTVTTKETNGNVIENGVSPNETISYDQKSPDEKFCLTRFSDSVATGFSNMFYWTGVRVARNPKKTIMFSLIAVASFSTGMLQRYEVPSGSGVGFLSEDNQVVKNAELSFSVFFIRERDQYILVVDDSDVLSTANFMTTLNIDKSVKASSTSAGASFSTICLKIDSNCKEKSLFELWSFDNTVLEGLSNSDVLTKVNEANLVSPVFGDNFEVSHVLGGIVRDSASQITSARAHLLHYVTISRNQDWENLFINVGRSSHQGVDVYVEASTSRSQESSGSYTRDLPLFFTGFAFIFIYIIVMAGKFSLLEHRIYIALMGVVAAGLSMSAGIGLTPCFGLSWTNLHLIVPFLVIGIGVDDMFVLLQTWNSVQDDANLKGASLDVKAGKVLQSAGVSITITSMTDLVAFAVGATSELAAFSSFSVFVAVCIIILFFLECTFFLACVVLDERRKEKRYDACLACCYKHDENYKPGKCAQREILHTIFEDGLGRLVTNIPFAVIAILTTLAVAGLMSWGFYKLEVRYDPDWYLPSSSYVVAFNNKYEEYFSFGTDASVYVINADFYSERQKLRTLYQNLQANSNLNPTYLTSWFEAFVSWKSSSSPSANVLDANAYANAAEFYTDVTSFVASSAGRRYLYDIVFKDNVIIGSKFDIRHREVTDQSQNIDIIDSVQNDCDNTQFSSGASVFPYGGQYFIYEITRIIKREVYRNIGITMLCVFIMVIPMLTSLQMGFWVALCVVMTTAEVAGSMYFAGLSIEASTIITLLLSIGLAVDYSAHVGHKFLTLKGSRKLRTRVTMGQIGLAVFNGGFSTFLALVMLAASDTYSYKVFFTVFVCVVGYGLWNGLVFLPCVLSIIGPKPHANASEARLSSRHDKNGKIHSDVSEDETTTTPM